MRTNIFDCLLIVVRFAHTIYPYSIDNLSMKQTLSRIERFINEGECHQHVVVNVDKIVKANRDPGLLDVINSCDLVNADGMPVVWASRLLGSPLKERVAGIDLFVKLIEMSANKG